MSVYQCSKYYNIFNSNFRRKKSRARNQATSRSPTRLHHFFYPPKERTTTRAPLLLAALLSRKVKVARK